MMKGGTGQRHRHEVVPQDDAAELCILLAIRRVESDAVTPGFIPISDRYIPLFYRCILDRPKIGLNRRRDYLLPESFFAISATCFPW